jgi:hypothetical protein
MAGASAADTDEHENPLPELMPVAPAPHAICGAWL